MKSPFELYRKLDDYLVARLNDLYLWAFDWTGVYVGTLIFLNGLWSITFLIQQGNMWPAAFVMLLLIIIAGMRYYLQSIGPEVFNKFVLAQPAIPTFRAVFVTMAVFFFMVHVTVLKDVTSYLRIMGDISDILFWYALDIKVRDREKKDFKLPKLAMERGS